MCKKIQSIHGIKYQSINDFLSDQQPIAFTDVKIGRGKNQYTARWINAGFDIETTQQYDLITDRYGRQHSTYACALMYIWQLNINGLTVLGRTWGDFIAILNYISKKLELNAERKTYIFIANMGFEFQHMCNYLSDAGLLAGDESVFAKTQRRPLKITLNNGIVFLDALQITNSSLKDLAKKFTKTQKAVGDLDYTIQRNQYTTLTEEELGYCINDVQILSEYAEYYFLTYVKNDKYIPMTSTMTVRHALKDIFLSKSKEYKKSIRKLIYFSFPTYPQYQQLMQLFAGGYVHANARNAEVTITPGEGQFGAQRDKKSMYPWAMLTRADYPMGKFHSVITRQYDSTEKLEKILNEYCCNMRVAFYNIKAKTSITTISESKCLSVLSAVKDNGRIYSADALCIDCTEFDFDIIKKFYTFEKMEILFLNVAKKDYLPEYVRDLVYTSYQRKENTPKDTTDYHRVKALLNSIYGCMVSKMVLEYQIWDGDWKTKAYSSEEIEEEFKNAKKSKILLPQWGVWVTSICRHTILTLVFDSFVKTGKTANFIYSDTDSIKYIGGPETEAYFERYNDRIRRNNRQVAETFGYDYSLISELGTFCREDDWQRFKTLGAKRYIYEDTGGKIHCTIAGLPKKALPEYLEKNKSIDIFDYFSRNMDVEWEDTGKLTSIYIDHPEQITVTDPEGNTVTETVPSCLVLIPARFKLSIIDDYINFIALQKNQAIEQQPLIEGSFD